MEEFPEEGAREPRRLEPTMETLDEWGGTPQSRMGKSRKINYRRKSKSIISIFSVEEVILH